MKIRNIIFLAAILASQQFMALASPQIWKEDVSDEEFLHYKLMQDSIEANDTIARMDSLAIANRPKPHQIHLISRSFPGRVALRWAPSDYITWVELNKAGYIVVRIDRETLDHDTLAVVRPLTLDQFKAKFSEDDNLAASAAELIWGDHTTENTIDAEIEMTPATAAKAADDLDQIFSTALLIAEQRMDIAEAMAMGYTDRNVKKGATYSYHVKANIPDSCMEIHSTLVTEEVSGTYIQPKYDVQLTDSISAPCNVSLMWPQTTYTSYDIERRGDNEDWVKVNKNPYVMFINTAFDTNSIVQYNDSPPGPGEYEYRVIAHDSFGEATLPTDPIHVSMPDMIPPMPPYVKRVYADHQTVDSVTVYIYFAKDTIEGDIKGYIPLYRPRIKGSENVIVKKEKGNLDTKTNEALDQAELTGEWQPMTDHWLMPTDTMCVCDVSGLPSGDITIMVSDLAGNVSQGTPQYLFLEDIKAPAAPDSLRANVAPDGTIVLRWNAPPDLDVRSYDVSFANDTTHTFLKISPPELTETMMVDSIAPGLNQAFIYYEVRAIDYSGNTSLPSERLRVVRPNFMPPHPCRIDSLYNDETHVYMRWIQPDEQDLAYTRMLKRKRPSTEWEILGTYPADSVRAQGNFIRIEDHPIPDMRNRYEYAMEAYNLNGVCSGLSLVSSVLHTGPKVLDLPITLMGNYKEDKKETVLAWELKAASEALPNNEWWYCVYRKGEGDNRFEFLLSTDKSENFFSDCLLKPGQSAEYYVKIRFNDGRFSQNSNVVKVTAPEEAKQQ